MLLTIISLNLFAEPIVSVNLPGLLGNRLFAFALAKVIGEEMHWQIQSKEIWGFPGTYNHEKNRPTGSYRTQSIRDARNFDLDLAPIINNKELRNIRLNGYFQAYKVLKPYKEKIRQWLQLDPELKLSKKFNSVVVHVRAQYPSIYYIPFEYYEKALEMVTYDKVYICTDDPDHPFLKNFEKYNPIIISTRNLDETMKKTKLDEVAKMNMDDFAFIASFDKIICSFSTYCWWAAFLSDASEIYAPYPTDPKFQHLIVDDEDRYHYIKTPIGQNKRKQ